MSTTIKDGIAITHLNPNIGGGGSIPESLVETTYSDLKALRDGGNLVAGQQYRITDYHCTTVQEDTQSADHQFDIIVTADNESTLNENARACLHDGDTYFTEAGANLSAWKIWYCLDNDTDRFAWADRDNGSGVIYRMIDEWNNDCPYDFKNIQFKRYYDADDECYKHGWSDINEWCYTFCMLDRNDGLAHDVSVEQFKYLGMDGAKTLVCQNTISADHEGAELTLNDIVFVTNTDISEIFEGYCFNSFGPGCYNITLGQGCSSNSFGPGCYGNTLSDRCSSNHLGDYCCFNTFGSRCYDKHLVRTEDQSLQGRMPEFWFNGECMWGGEPS